MKLHEPFTFFVDRSLGAKVITGFLSDAGYLAEAHDDHFHQRTDDLTWLPFVGERGWVLLTKDRAIKRNTLEFHALCSARVAAFFFSSAGVPGPQMGRGFVGAMRKMEKVLRRYEPPFIAYVTLDSSVSVHYAQSAWLSPPRRVK